MKLRLLITVIMMLSRIMVTHAQHSGKTQHRQTKQQHVIHFIFTSDVHFGLVREYFRGKKNVTSAAVNAAMIEQMNKLPGTVLPADKAVGGGQKIKNFEAIIITGDIANREESGVQSAAQSWNEFEKAYRQLLHLKTAAGKTIPLLLTPGNHDASNAIGYRKPLVPATDASSLIGMYNMEMHPAIKKNYSNFNYVNDKIHYAVSASGIHLVFVSLWPDAEERAWMQKDLSKLKHGEPVLLFTHSMPDVEARFFINPNSNHNINDSDKFENLLGENFKDGPRTTDSALIEQRALVKFLQLHPGIKTYFHGHSNYTEFYDWHGPDKNINLHCFRADSPMKGKYSAKDETKLSFIVVSIDTVTKRLTARECLWNTKPQQPDVKPVWGQSVSVSL